MSDYSRQYTSGVSWENLSSTATPISAGNLNKMDNAILRIDEAAYTAINTKANQTTVNGCINNVAFESTTGVFTITFVNGSTVTINTALEKVVTNFTYNSATQSLVLTLEDGSTQNISLAEFITQYEFEDTATIDFSVTDGKVSAIVKNGSITGEKLNPNYLTQITSQVNSAKDYARQSQSYALGNAVDDEGDPYREGQATDNAKYYYQKAHEAASEAGAEPFIGATSSTGGTAGLVPAPLIADREKFLKGNGSWGEAGELSWTGTQAQWDALSSSEKAEYDGKKVYITDDYMQNIPVMTGASANDGGYKGLVPTPHAGDEIKVLFGNGAWGNAVTSTKLPDNTSANDVTDDHFAIHYCDAWADTPQVSGYSNNGTLIVIPRSGNNLIQVYLFTSVGGGIFVRSRTSGGAYNSWHSFTLTSL